MKKGDLVRDRYNNNSIGVIVEERIRACVDGFDFLYKVDWLDGNRPDNTVGYLVDHSCLEVINEEG